MFKERNIQCGADENIGNEAIGPMVVLGRIWGKGPEDNMTEILRMILDAGRKLDFTHAKKGMGILYQIWKTESKRSRRTCLAGRDLWVGS